MGRPQISRCGPRRELCPALVSPSKQPSPPLPQEASLHPKAADQVPPQLLGAHRPVCRAPAAVLRLDRCLTPCAPPPPPIPAPQVVKNRRVPLGPASIFTAVLEAAHQPENPLPVLLLFPGRDAIDLATLVDSNAFRIAHK